MKSYDHLDFPSEAAHLRSSDWAVVSSPAGPQDSRIGTTGPASPAKMAITALSSGAKVWLADRDDALRTDARLAVVVARDELLVKTCHHRNASANGGMADVIPNRPEPGVTAAQPLDTASAPGQVTEAGLCSTQCVAISCVAVWLSGSDAVAIHNLTEDAATAELRAPVGDDRVGDDLVGDDAFSAHYGPVGTVIADFLTTRADELLLQ